MINSKKIVSLFTAVSMTAGAFALYANAEEEPKSVSILYAAQKDGEFIDVPHYMTVTDGIAEEYGYDVIAKDINEPTFLDALVTASKEKYGDKFTKETASQYLDISDQGWLTTAYQSPASATGYYINSVMPEDFANAAKLKEGDAVEYFFYQDAGYGDKYTFFDTKEKTVKAGESFDLTLTMSGYDESWQPVESPVDGTSDKNAVTINTINADGSISEPLEASIDANGKTSLEFDEPGTYMVTAQGFVNETNPIVAPICIVTVEPKSVNILYAAQKDGAFIDVPHYMTVTDGIAEEYGYDVIAKDVDEPTFLDALVTASKEKYGDKFTKETASQYLGITDQGWLTTAYQSPASATGYYINSVMPEDFANAAKLKEGDAVEYFFYQDAGYGDKYTFFDTKEKTVKAGESFDLMLTMSGYGEGYIPIEIPVDGTSDKNAVTINTINEDGSISEPLEASIDANGKTSLEFDEPGTYMVTAQGFVNETNPIVAPICIVTVEPTAEPTTSPSEEPTAEPTALPSEEPTASPSEEPTTSPSAEPTTEPTALPSEEPTTEPTASPSAEPTAEPTASPSAEPTTEPTALPSAEPTSSPSAEPTTEPTTAPSDDPKKDDINIGDNGEVSINIDGVDTAVLAVVKYENGRLKEIKLVNVTFENGKANTTINVENGDILMVWNSINEMISLTDKKIIE